MRNGNLRHNDYWSGDGDDAAARHAAVAAAIRPAEIASQTNDTTPPLLSFALPPGDQPGVPTTTDVQLGFNEAVQAGLGNIVLHNAADGSVFESIPAADTSRVTFDAGGVVIDPAADLLRGASYYVTIDPTAITDLAGNPYAGVSSTTQIEFTVSPTIEVHGGEYVVQADQTVAIAGAGFAVLDGFLLEDYPTPPTPPRLTNNGTVTVTGDAGAFVVGVGNDSGGFLTGSLFWNKAGAHFTVDGSGGATTYGFYSGSWSSDVTNDGTLTVSGTGNAYGILSYSPDFVVANTGTLSVTAGGAAAGCFDPNGGAFSNSGSISVTGHADLTYGVRLTYSYSFDNSGTITVADDGAPGVGVEFSNLDSEQQVIHNSGTITAAIAIEEYQGFTPQGPNDTLIDNSGTIDGAVVLSFAGGTRGTLVHTIDNSGTINGDVTFGSFDDVFNGAGGTLNGVITGGAGNDHITGGAGATVVAFSGQRGDYAFSYDAATQTYTIADQRGGSPDGSDTVSHVSQLRFSDGTYGHDAAGELTRLFDTGGGTTKAVVYDVLNTQPWAEQRSFFDAQGSLSAQAVLEHNGTIWTNDYGGSPSVLWNTYENDAHGNLVSGVGAFSDGSYDLTIFDNTNAYRWSQATVQFDAQGNEHFLFGTNDDGSATVTAADVVAALDTVLWFTAPYDVSAGGTPSETPISGGANADILFGFGGNDTLDGAGGNDLIVGGAGNDTLTGGTGDDKFVFHFGDGLDTVTDFAPGDASGDVIELHNCGVADFAALQPYLSQSGADTLIAFDAQNHIVLHNVQLAQLDAGDFLFH